MASRHDCTVRTPATLSSSSPCRRSTSPRSRTSPRRRSSSRSRRCSAQLAQQIANLAVTEQLRGSRRLRRRCSSTLAKVAEALQALLSTDPPSDEPLDDPPIKAIIAGLVAARVQGPRRRAADRLDERGDPRGDPRARAQRCRHRPAAPSAHARVPTGHRHRDRSGPRRVRGDDPGWRRARGRHRGEPLAGSLTRGPTTVRAFARATRNLRNSIYRVGLVEGLETAIAGTSVGEAIEGGFTLPEALLRPKPTSRVRTRPPIELPWRLLLSPSRDGAFFHSQKAVEGETGRTELWHTRLGSTQNGDIARVDPKRILRAIWALSPPGWKQVTTPTDPKDLSYMPEDVDDDPFRASLNEYERHSVVHLSSNFRLRKPPPSKGCSSRTRSTSTTWRCRRSAAGSTRGAPGRAEQPLGISVEEWRHRATLGRDHFVRVV